MQPPGKRTMARSLILRALCHARARRILLTSPSLAHARSLAPRSSRPEGPSSLASNDRRRRRAAQPCCTWIRRMRRIQGRFGELWRSGAHRAAPTFPLPTDALARAAASLANVSRFVSDRFRAPASVAGCVALPSARVHDAHEHDRASREERAEGDVRARVGSRSQYRDRGQSPWHPRPQPRVGPCYHYHKQITGSPWSRLPLLRGRPLFPLPRSGSRPSQELTFN